MLKASIYFDRFWFPWSTPGIFGPSDGFDFRGAAIWERRQKMTAVLSYRLKGRDVNSVSIRLPGKQKQQTHQLSAALTFFVSKSIRLKNNGQLEPD